LRFSLRSAIWYTPTARDMRPIASRFRCWPRCGSGRD